VVFGPYKRASVPEFVSSLADLSGRILTSGHNKLNAHLCGEERIDVRFEDQWIDNSIMAERGHTMPKTATAPDVPR
jgi:hypothetical protein